MNRSASTPSLLALITSLARSRPGKTALVFRNERLTYLDLWRHVRAAAASLSKQGLGPGDRVLIAAYQGPAPIAAFYGAQWIGAIPVLVSQGQLSNLEAIARDTDARAVVLDDDATTSTDTLSSADGQQVRTIAASSLTPAPAGEIVPDTTELPYPASPEAVSGVVLSGGTTGVPKAITRTHEADYWYGVHKAVMYRMGDDDALLYKNPRHLTALIGDIRVLLVTGATLVVVDGFRPEEILETVPRERVTHVALLASEWARLVDHDAAQQHRWTTIKQYVCSASSASDELKRRVRERFGVRPFLQVYGATETGIIAALQDTDVTAPPAVTGRLLPGVEARIAEHLGEIDGAAYGELMISSPAMATGYLHPQAGNAFSEGWFRTGDLGTVDANGYLRVYGRRAEAFEYHGRLLLPGLIQLRLGELEWVQEAGFTNVGTSEAPQPVAFVVARPGAEIQPDSIQARIAATIGAPLPELRIVPVKTLPRTPNGKLDFRALQALA